ncbi:hypothetical protein BC830DRAFT_1144796 [Chytriomyces sp. MP71]|nr:hypothetical protein BC830DRAFT_1144796 [Chytriomyces sp. MP71]
MALTPLVTTRTQNGNQNICCPTANHIAITCVPTASDCTTLEVDDTTPDVPNNGKAPAMSASVSSTVTTTSKPAAASSSNGGNNEPATAASSSARASASANSAQNSGVGGTNPTGNSGLSVGAIVSISLGCVLVAAALLVGAFGQISRMRQKPVVLQTDAQEAEWGLIGTGALPSRADGQFAIAKV